MTNFIRLFILIPTLILSVVGVANAAPDAETAYILNSFSFLVHGFLVMLMALGFTCLEAGLVRTKNTATIRPIVVSHKLSIIGPCSEADNCKVLSIHSARCQKKNINKPIPANNNNTPLTWFDLSVTSFLVFLMIEEISNILTT